MAFKLGQKVTINAEHFTDKLPRKAVIVGVHETLSANFMSISFNLEHYLQQCEKSTTYLIARENNDRIIKDDRYTEKDMQAGWKK